MKNITLNNGIEMPVLGFGVFQVPAEETEAAVAIALEVGYRSLDTAAAYGNEKAVGAAIASSGIPRDELFVTTKLWVQDAPAESETAKSFDTSLAKLGLDYVDLYLIHQPFGDYYGQWRAMEGINREGRARAIGVSNFSADRLLDLVINNEIKPAVNQIETNPFNQRTEYQQLMVGEGIQIESWAPFAEGKNDLFSNPVLTKIGDAHGKSPAQAVLRWLIQRDVIVIPKSVRRERMEQNLDVFDFELTTEQMAEIVELETGGSQFFDHEDPDMVRWLSARRLDS